MSSALLRDTSAADRFWYWRGASGKRYIHSVYPAEACPPLPGAVYVLVRRTGALRTASRCGRFSTSWTAPDQAFASGFDAGQADEIHVHLLAGSDAEAQAIAADLAAALRHEDGYIDDMAA